MLRLNEQVKERKKHISKVLTLFTFHTLFTLFGSIVVCSNNNLTTSIYPPLTANCKRVSSS